MKFCRWYVIFGVVICGISVGLYWVVEGVIIFFYLLYVKRG